MVAPSCDGARCEHDNTPLSRGFLLVFDRELPLYYDDGEDVRVCCTYQLQPVYECPVCCEITDRDEAPEEEIACA